MNPDFATCASAPHEKDGISADANPIPIPRIPISLKMNESTSKVDPKELRQELHNIGLTCRFTSEESLRKDIDSVVSGLVKSPLQGFGYFEYKSADAAAYHERGALKSLSECIGDLDIDATWTPDSVVPCMTQLAAIGYPEHFDYLKEHYVGFTGNKSEQTQTGSDSSHDVILNTFESLAKNMASALVVDLNADEVEACFKNIIEPSIESGDNYESGLQNRSIYLVKGVADGSCDGVGVLNVQWKLKVENYKNKKEEKHQFTLYIAVRSALYTDLAELKAECDYIRTVFKDKMFYTGVLGGAIPMPSGVTVYDKLPRADEDAFVHSLPLQTETNDYIEAAVFYAPDAENIGCLDNTGSSASTSYSKTIASGFTYGSQQTVSAGFSFSLEAGFVKAGFNFGMEFTLSEQWSSEQSETITVEVPADSKAYLYQGLLHVAVLRFSKKDMVYEYREKETFKSTMVRTSPEPILEEPAMLIMGDKRGNGETERSLWELSAAEAAEKLGA